MKTTVVNRRYGNAMLVAVMALLFLFFIVQTLFNSKGEPREAIVAVSMLQSGNWILPVSFGGDIPYKPPFLAWCIAAVSWVFGGNVTEFTSRLPSVVAAAVLVVATNRFFRNRSGSEFIGAATAWVTISSLEVFRAATACRVDMMLTMFIVCAMYSLATFFRRGCPGVLPWLSIAMMAGAALTKGPVGVALPCLAVGIWRLTSGDRFWPLFLRLVVAGILACAVPALWYAAAWQQGGQAFADLALEENLGRLTGTMSYASHENPFYYNFITILAGMTPYTLLGVMALFVVRWRGLGQRVRAWWADRRNWQPLAVYAAVMALTVLVVYTIPKSKRSVYLLPMYPFMAYYVVLLVMWLQQRKPMVLKVFTRVMASLAVLVPVAYGVLLTGALDGVKAVARLDFHQPVSMIFPGLLLGLISVFVGLGAWRGASKRQQGKSPRFFNGMLGDASLSIFAIYLMLNIAVLPTLLSAKSDRYLADEVNARLSAGAPLYSKVEGDNALRFYTLNFYLDDRIRLFDAEMPRKGLLVIGRDDFEAFSKRHQARYRFTTVYEGERKSCDVRQIPLLVEFRRR